MRATSWRISSARRHGHDVIFVRNTTEAINVLAAALPARTHVLSSPVEHHANMLPWRRHDVSMLPFPESADALCAACEHALIHARPRIDLVAVTGASNVTGEVWPLGRLAEIAHRHGAQLFVDGAQLAPHRPIDMAADGIDFLALSGHKLYAPFGAGALVGPVGRLGDSAPLLHGGGAVKLVTPDDVIWADTPERHEAGSPNVVGVVALGAACRALGALGMEAVAEHERTLADRLRRGLATVPGLEQLAIWRGDEVDRVGVASFALRGYRHPLLAAILSAEHAIGVRHGCFCAHPLITRLLGIPDREVRRLAAELLAGATPPLPGAVRASLGLGTTEADIDRLTGALEDIARSGPAMRYQHVAAHDEYRPAMGGHQLSPYQCAYSRAGAPPPSPRSRPPPARGHPRSTTWARRRAAGPGARGYGRAGCSRASRTLKSLLTSTSSSSPALVLMCDS